MSTRAGTAPLAPPERLHAPVLFALALVARWHVLAFPDAPVLGWRQADMLSVTRNFGRNGFRLLWPQIDWGGAGPGFVEMEFPILPWIGAVLQKLFGPHELLSALVPLAASLGLVFAIAALTRRVLGPDVAFWAGAFAALSPQADRRSRLECRRERATCVVRCSRQGPRSGRLWNCPVT